MKCPRCGAASGVSETRTAANLTTRRARVCEHGHRFATVEIHQPVFCAAKPRAREFAATTMRRLHLRERDRTIAAELHRGWRLLADKFQMTKTAVYEAARRGRRA